MNSKLFLPLLLITALIVVPSLEAEEITTSVEVSHSRVRIAEPFEVVIKLNAPAGTRVYFPQVETQFGAFEIVDSSDMFDIPEDENSERRSWVRRLTLESLQTGEPEIPSIEIPTKTDTAEKLVQTPSKTVQIVSVLENEVDPMKFRDIKEVVDIESRQPQSYAWVVWTIASAGALAIVCIALVRFKNRKQWITPGQWATRELRLIYESDVIHSGDAPVVLNRIDETVRGYLQTQYEIPAAKQTAAELTTTLESARVPEELIAGMSRLFDSAELAKFAGAEFESAELSSAVDEALCLISNLEALELAPADLSQNKVEAR